MPRWLAITLGLVVATAPLLVAIHFYRKTTAFLATARTAPGVVTAYELVTSADSDGGSSSSSHPVIMFGTPDGQRHTFRGRTGWRNPGVVGETVEVLYDPSDPSYVRTSGFFSLWGGAVVFGSLALLCLGGVYVMFGPQRDVVRPVTVFAASSTASSAASSVPARICPRCGHHVGHGTLNCPKCFAPQ